MIDRPHIVTVALSDSDLLELSSVWGLGTADDMATAERAAISGGIAQVTAKVWLAANRPADPQHHSSLTGALVVLAVCLLLALIAGTGVASAQNDNGAAGNPPATPIPGQ